MEAPENIAVYSDVMVVLGTAAVLVPVMQRYNVSPVLGFLLSGAVLGPHGFGSFATTSPVIDWLTVGSEGGLGAFGELGVVFLLFLIGLELSLQRLVTMRRLVFGLGGLQVFLCALAIGLFASMMGAPTAAATLIGLSLALSSTAIVLELLSAQGQMATATGRSSFSVLLLQDLAVVPLLLLVTVFGERYVENVGMTIVTAFFQAGVVIALIVLIGSVALRPLFRLVAASNNTELFVAATLLVAVGSGLATAGAGLSMALGAFVAGLLLAESEFRRAIEAALEPFKGLMLGVFFFTVGMSIDLLEIAANPLFILGGILALVAIKSVILSGLLWSFGFSWPVTVRTSLLLGPGGEFAFIIIGLSMTSGLITTERGGYILAITSLSMALIPLFDAAGRWLATRIEEADTALPDPMLTILPPIEEPPEAIVIGHGRVGQLVSDMLTQHGVKHVVTERIPNLVSEARREGRPVYFGDGKSTAFLDRCGLKQAKAVIITMHSWDEIDELVAAVRAGHPKIVIVARARDSEHARHLYEIGVTDAVPETVEASLQLSEATLVGIGIPTGPVIASIHEKRDEFRAALQKAARAAGRAKQHGMRAKKESMQPPSTGADN